MGPILTVAFCNNLFCILLRRQTETLRKAHLTFGQCYFGAWGASARARGSCHDGIAAARLIALPLRSIEALGETLTHLLVDCLPILLTISRFDTFLRETIVVRHGVGRHGFVFHEPAVLFLPVQRRLIGALADLRRSEKTINFLLIHALDRVDPVRGEAIHLGGDLGEGFLRRDLTVHIASFMSFTIRNLRCGKLALKTPLMLRDKNLLAVLNETLQVVVFLDHLAKERSRLGKLALTLFFRTTFGMNLGSLLRDTLAHGLAIFLLLVVVVVSGHIVRCPLALVFIGRVIDNFDFDVFRLYLDLSFLRLTGRKLIVAKPT